MGNTPSFDFAIVGGDAVHEIVSADKSAIVSLVGRTYAALGAGRAINPDSYFLRFPDKPNSRIIALPAYLGGEFDVAGIKWIASFPDNIARGIPRASAVLILNDYETGYPLACVESSIISAARTAASAVLGAEWLQGGAKSAPAIGFIGTGIISRTIAEFFLATGWSFERAYLYDLSRDYSEALGRHLESLAKDIDVSSVDSAADAIRRSDVVVFATTSASPHVADPRLFAHCPAVLHISLRDLSPEVILASQNIVDDVEHCLKANTSPHLAEQKVGHRDFIVGTLDELMRGAVKLAPDRTRIFSPFGMGIFDLAVGLHVYRQALASGRAVRIPNFFHERTRW